MQNIIVSLVLFGLAFITLTEGHSYVECADWRFKNPNAPGWAEDQGTCYGYARKWPKGQYPNVKFGMFDDIWSGWKDQGQLTYSSAKNPNSQPACHPDFQSRTNPITSSYAPANSKYGAMVTTSPGKQLCFTWSGRNHADGGERCVDRSGIVCPVYINLAPAANTDADQATMSANNIAKVTFQNCTRNDARYNNANRPCGGCFTVPQRAPGVYTIQWRWALNHDGGSGFDEVYTTCIDVNIVANSNNNNPTPTSNANQPPKTSANNNQPPKTSANNNQPQRTSQPPVKTSQQQPPRRTRTRAHRTRFGAQEVTDYTYTEYEDETLVLDATDNTDSTDTNPTSEDMSAALGQYFSIASVFQIIAVCILLAL